MKNSEIRTIVEVATKVANSFQMKSKSLQVKEIKDNVTHVTLNNSIAIEQYLDFSVEPGKAVVTYAVIDKDTPHIREECDNAYIAVTKMFEMHLSKFPEKQKI